MVSAENSWRYGILPSGVPGVRPGKALILGAGVVGTNAARVAFGIGMDVIVLNRGSEKLQKIDELYRGSVKTLPLTESTITREIVDADMVIGQYLYREEKHRCSSHGT